MAHTPGPWIMGERHRLPDTDTGEQWGYTLTAVGSTTIEQVLGATFHVATVGANPGDAECEANARLIACAPEMLDALKRIAHKQLWGDGSFSVAELCNSLIAKAEGVTMEDAHDSQN